MLLIVAHHYVVNTGVFALTYSAPLSAPSIFYRIMGAWGKTGINIFILITGYFMCKSSISMKKYVKILAEIEFYKILIFFVFVITKYERFSIKGLIKAIVPVINIKSDFISCFLVFYLLIPFLNVLVRNLVKRKHAILLIILFFTYSVLGLLPGFVNMNYVSWFVVLYLFASYLRFYPNRFTETIKGSAALLSISIVLAITSIVFCAFINEYAGIQVGYFFVSDSNQILAVLVAIGAFLFFKNLPIRNSTIINMIAGSTFGVLLIHANSGTMRLWLWGDFIDSVGHYDVQGYYLYALGSVIIVFLFCVIIDRLRIILLEKAFIKLFNTKEMWLKSTWLGYFFEE